MEETISAVKTDKQLVTRVGKVLSHDKAKGGFSTCLMYEPDEEAQKAHGSLYFVVDIGSPSPLTPDIAYNLIDIVKEEYYSDLELSASESFENALKAANEELAAIAKEGEKDWIGKLNVIVAAVADREIHLVQRGTAEAHLLRGNNMINLSKGMYTPGESYRPEETLLNLIEGELEVNDKLIVSTSELFYYISIEKLRRMMEGQTPAQAAKRLASVLEQEDEIHRTSVMVVEFSTPELLAQEEETEPAENWVGEPQEEAPRRAKKLSFFKGGTTTTLPVEDKTKTVAEALESIPQEQISEPPRPTVVESRFTPTLPREELVIDETNEPSSHPSKVMRPSLGQIKPSINISDYQKKIKLNSNQLRNAGTILWKILKVVGLIILTGVDAVFTIVSNAVKNIKKRPGGDRILLGVVVVLIIAIVGSTLAFASGQSNRIGSKKAITALADAQQKRDAAQAALIYEDTAKARELLTEAYLAAESATHNKRTQTEATVLLVELQKQIDNVSNVTRFVDVQPVADFGTLQSQLASSGNASAQVKLGNLIVLGGNVYTIDPDNNKVYKYKASSGEVAIINSLVSTDKKFKLGAVLSETDLMFYTTPPQVYSLNLDSNSMAVKGLDAGSWNNADSIIPYTDRLYFLDSANNQIWKYKAIPEGYTQIAPYFENNVGTDLSGALDFGIEGNVFVLLLNNVIKKFSGGGEVQFGINGLPGVYPAVGNITSLYISNDTPLYLLDATNHRVLAFDTEGTYVAQYIYDNIDNPTDMTVDQAGGFIYLSAGTKVYRLPLK